MARVTNYPTVAQPEVEPDELQATVDMHMRIMQTSKVDMRDPVAVRQRIEWYFNLCKEYHTRPFVEGLSSSLHISRMRLWQIANGEGEVADIIRDAKHLILSLLETWHITGKINPVSALFLSKNLGGYTDVVQVEPINTAPRPVLTPEQIQQKLTEDLPIDDITAED